ncbi:MAG: hypothetical protein ACJ746_20895 [Bryobacteraceae bacterium]
MAIVGFFRQEQDGLTIMPGLPITNVLIFILLDAFSAISLVAQQPGGDAVQHDEPQKTESANRRGSKIPRFCQSEMWR